MSHPQNNRPLRLESLQSRELMAVDLVGGELRITGTEANDQIEVSQELRAVLVRDSFRFRIETREMVRVEIQDANQRTIENRLFDAASVDKVFAEGRGGDDTIINDTDLPATLYGNDGNDLLRGGSANDTLVGGNHHDTLYGRGGQDFLFGQGGNDGLFGGEDHDMLYGGSGANRYLSTLDGDFMFRPDGNDAVLEFRGSAPGAGPYGFYTGGSWNDEQVELVDRALERIHQQSGSTRLLEASDGDRLRFYHHGMILVGSADIPAWNYADAIHVHNGAFDWGSTPLLNELATQQTILHEIGHNWDSPEENSSVGQFRTLSGWSSDGLRHRANITTDFARRYGARDALEDFATTFAAHFMRDEYIDYENDWTFADYTNRPVMQRKLAYMDLFDSMV